MTTPHADEVIAPTALDDVVAVHLAAIAEVHTAAMAHIAACAEQWLQPAASPSPASPATNEIAALTDKPAVKISGIAAA